MSVARRLRGDRDRAAHLDGERRVAGAGAGRREVRGARAGRSRTSCSAQKIGLNEIDQALQNWNVNLPTGQLFGPHRDLQHQGRRPAERTPPQFRPIVVAYRQRRAGAARAGGQRHRQRREHAERLVVLHEGRAASARSPCRSCGSPAPTRSRSPTPSARCCRRSDAQLPPSVHLTRARRSLEDHPRRPSATSS